ncbi:MAG: HAMP domain-containing protein [Spirochaetes bacterium]|nr:HAMP domain-containing protein [Spirochaetota bacterium]
MDTHKFGFFKRLKIREKLISIISLIILVSMSTMIFLATFFFKTDTKIRIEELNLKIAEIAALKVRTDFMAMTEKMHLMATTLMQEFRSPVQKNMFLDLFFRNDKDFLGLLVIGKTGEKLEVTNSIYNKTFFTESKLNPKMMEEIAHSSAALFGRTFGEEAIVYNASDKFNIPVLAVGLPFIKEDGKVISALIGYLKMDRFLQAFRSGYIQTYMINSEGDLIAHSDGKLILSKGNFINVPIVKLMLSSNKENEFRRYKNVDGEYHFGSYKKVGFAGTGVIATVREDVALAEVYRIQRRNLMIMIIVLNIAVLIVYFFAKTLTTPLIKLVGATKEIEQGNFRVNIIPASADEIGQLTESFIAMGKGLEEREKLKETFGKFVNKEIAEQVLKGEIKLGGERKNVAVFFSDIRSFTAMSEKLEPEEVVEFLNEYFTRMVACVNNTGGVVDKFIGDAIMAVWGAPVSYGNDIENAINGALMMRNELLLFNRGRGSVKKPIIRIGCGINYGPVLAGQIGSEERMEYTVIGDTVNLASRIEALNKPFGTDILISQDAYEMVKDIYRVEPMQKIKVKGKSEPQQIYAVLGKRSDPHSPKTLEELRALLGIEMKGKPAAVPEEEIKYEIIE